MKGEEFMKYHIEGGSFPVAICELEPNESMITEGGGMSWMSPNVQMETTTNGGIGKALGRMFARESLFQNRYTARNGAGMIAFASSFPGNIVPLDLSDGRKYICQKSAFLASTPDVNLEVIFRKKLGVGLFGGEGFIMQRLSGTGVAFIEIDGSSVKYNLGAGEQLVLDTGHLVMMSATCNLDIQTVKGAKNILFGGEGLFNTVVTGPGEVIVQTMPVPKLAQALIPYMPQSSSSNN